MNELVILSRPWQAPSCTKKCKTERKVGVFFGKHFVFFFEQWVLWLFHCRPTRFNSIRRAVLFGEYTSRIPLFSRKLFRIPCFLVGCFKLETGLKYYFICINIFNKIRLERGEHRIREWNILFSLLFFLVVVLNLRLAMEVFQGWG